MSQSKPLSFIYNPANQSPEQLVAGFVIRKKEFRKIIKALGDTDLDCAAQHFLIQGQRGTGKTSLLLRLGYEIQNNSEFEHLQVVQFAEEQYNIFDLCRLWESTAEALEEVEGFEHLSEQLAEHCEDSDYRECCFDYIEQALVRCNKRLVLLLDNFGDILNRLSDIEQMRLRDIFHNSNHIQLIGSSATVMEHTYKHDKPFFEFFSTIQLDGLNQRDVITLMQRLAKSNPDSGRKFDEVLSNQPQRIETIRRLTAGIPRTIVLLFDIVADDSASVFDDLEQLLDRVTPLYKHRMDDLPTQQQAIMDTIALNWDGISAKEIVLGLKSRGFNSKTVSAQLVLLSRNDLVESKNIDKKNKLYFIKERFFNIWYLMRYGRKKNKEQVKWLVRFLQQWCTEEELLNRTRNHIACARTGTLHGRGGYYMAEALAEIVPDRNLQHELITETRTALRQYDPDIDRNLRRSDFEIRESATGYYYKQEFNLAIGHLEALIERGDIDAMFNLALLYHTERKDFEKAISYYQMAIEKGDADAMYNLALLYQAEVKNFEKAISYYHMAVEKGHPDAMNNLAFHYYTDNSNKAKSLPLIKKAYALEKNIHTTFALATILLWHDQYRQSVEAFYKMISQWSYEEYVEEITDYFLLLLSKKQLHLALDLFTELDQLKTQFKPVYYALMTLLKDEYPKEYLKMGSELTDTVNEILHQVENKPQK